MATHFTLHAPSKTPTAVVRPAADGAGFSHLADRLIHQGSVVSFYQGTFRSPDGEVFHRASTDGGKTWSEAKALTDDPDNEGDDLWKILVLAPLAIR